MQLTFAGQDGCIFRNWHWNQRVFSNALCYPLPQLSLKNLYVSSKEYIRFYTWTRSYCQYQQERFATSQIKKERIPGGHATLQIIFLTPVNAMTQWPANWARALNISSWEFFVILFCYKSTRGMTKTTFSYLTVIYCFLDFPMSTLQLLRE